MKMIRRENNILSSTHKDSQGEMMAKSALESMVLQLNGNRKPRIGLEHNITIPPLGIITNGKILEGIDNEFYLMADHLYFDKQEIVYSNDGIELVKEYFSEGTYPFIEGGEKEVSKIKVGTDPTNFESLEDVLETYKLIKEISGYEFEESVIGRKSEMPDPETIITIGKTIAVILGISKTKILEKLGDSMGDDLAKFYKLISTIAVETIKKVKPSNRPKNFIIIYPNSECSIELVIKTHKADEVLSSLQIEKLSPIDNKVQQLKNLNPEKIQFIYNENNQWEFNYMLSKEGSVFGTKKSFNKRNNLYNQILINQTQQN